MHILKDIATSQYIMKFAYELLERLVASIKNLEKEGFLRVKYRSVEIDEDRKEISLHLSLGFDEATWQLIFEKEYEKEENEKKVVRLEFTESVKTQEQVQK